MHKLKLTSVNNPAFVLHAICDMIHNVLYHAILTFIIHHPMEMYMFL